MINVLTALMDKADNMEAKINNVSREIEILRKNEKEMLDRDQEQWNKKRWAH